MNGIIKRTLALLTAAALLLTGCSKKNKSGAASTPTVQSAVESVAESKPESLPESSPESSAESTAASQPESAPESVSEPPDEPRLYFRNKKLLEQHYQKHGIDMGFASAEEYEKAASDVVYDPEVLHKIEKEDGDDVYYVERTNEFVVVSTDGYLRTYFNPDRGIDYFNKQ